IMTPDGWVMDSLKVANEPIYGNRFVFCVLRLATFDGSSRSMIPPEMVDMTWCFSGLSDLAMEKKWVEMVNPGRLYKENLPTDNATEPYVQKGIFRWWI
ncbi:hypothetical protein A2U01_0030453, partial [Trifolium medium]|nr:hypothetical protein [Trifolium medium]